MFPDNLNGSDLLSLIVGGGSAGSGAALLVRYALNGFKERLGELHDSVESARKSLDIKIDKIQEDVNAIRTDVSLNKVRIDNLKETVIR